MAVSPDPPPQRPRRKRYVREAGAELATLTPAQLELLLSVAEYGIVSLPQLARLGDLSPKSARRRLRDLFDAGLVRVLPVTRAALADPDRAAEMVCGSAPNIYTATQAGWKFLFENGLVETRQPVPEYGPQSLLLRHALAIRDVRLWLELSARAHSEQRLERWHDGKAAYLVLTGDQTPGEVRPDAWFVDRLGARVLVGLLEVDRATERGTARWLQKIAAYDALFRSGQLKALTGYENARVLVIAPHARRRDHLVHLLATHAAPPLARRFWLADRSVLEQPGLSVASWRQPDSPTLRPLITDAIAGQPG